MHLTKILLYMLSFLLQYLPIAAQQKVQSKSYNTLLKKLLSHTVPEITVQQCKNSITTYTLLDARELNEYAVSHLYNAIPVGYNSFGINALANLPKTTPILVYCSVGYRSEKVTEKIIAAGYTNVQNLYGGIFEWVNAGQPVTNLLGSTTNVHPYNSTWGIWLKKGTKKYNY